MKKLTFIFGLAMALTAFTAQASTISLSPTNVSVVRGQTVTVTVTVDSAGATLGTVESNISYPSSILTPVSFSFAPSWMQLTQSGYDQMSGGTVIKTAGYPGGFTGTKVLGTLTFKAVANGAGSIQVQNSSIAYNTGNQNTITGAQGSAQVAVVGSTASPAVITTTVNANTSVNTSAPAAGTAANNAAAVGAADTSAQPAATASTSDQTAAVAGAAGGFTMPMWGWILLALIVIGGGAWLYMSRAR